MNSVLSRRMKSLDWKLSMSRLVVRCKAMFGFESSDG